MWPPLLARLTRCRADALDAASAQFLGFVQTEVDGLTTKTQAFSGAFASGKDDTARAIYADARVHWEGIEPVAESFGDLDPSLDLQGRVNAPDFVIAPFAIGDGAKEPLGELTTSKITGEEVWSGTDLSDLHRNVDGAYATYESLRPIVATTEPVWVTELGLGRTGVSNFTAKHLADIIEGSGAPRHG